MQKTMQVTAMLFTAGQDFTVKAGQQVMIVAGVAIGVYSGDKAVPLALLPSSVDSRDEVPRKCTTRSDKGISRVQGEEKNRARRISSGGFNADGTPSKPVSQVMEAIKRTLQEHGSMSISELDNRIQDEVDLGTKGWKRSVATRVLLERGEIHATGRTNNRMIHPANEQHP